MASLLSSLCMGRGTKLWRARSVSSGRGAEGALDLIVKACCVPLPENSAMAVSQSLSLSPLFSSILSLALQPTEIRNGSRNGSYD